MENRLTVHELPTPLNTAGVTGGPVRFSQHPASQQVNRICSWGYRALRPSSSSEMQPFGKANLSEFSIASTPLTAAWQTDVLMLKDTVGYQK